MKRRLIGFTEHPADLLGLVALVVALWWGLTNDFYLDLVALGALYSFVALALYIPFILGGSLSFAYPAYLAIGGLVVGLVANKTGWPILVAIPIGVIISVTAAVVLGAFTHRLSGFHLAAVTLMFAIAFASWSQSAPIAGGASGYIISRPAWLFGLELSRPYLVSLMVIIVGVTTLLTVRLRSSVYGIILRALKGAPASTKACGISDMAAKIISLAIGAAIASIAGSLFVILQRAIAPGTFRLSVVFLALFMPILGGRKSPWGALLGAAIIVYLSFGIDLLKDAGTFTFSAALLLVLVVAPDGILGIASRLLALGKRSRGVGDGSSREAVPATISSVTEVRPADTHLGQLLPSRVPDAAGTRDGSSEEPLLAVRSVSKHYGGVVALSDMSLEIHRGETVGLVGPNGAGKTTLVDIICGVIPPTSGQVLVNGAELTGSVPQRARSGFARTFQHPLLAEDLSVLDNLRLPTWSMRYGSTLGLLRAVGTTVVPGAVRESDERIEQWAQLFGLGDLERPAADLTLGEQRLVEVVRGLLMDPTVLLLDEPYAGCDARGAEIISQAIVAVAAQGYGVLLVDHNIDLVADVATRMDLLHMGERRFSGPSAECMASPEMREVYLG